MSCVRQVPATFAFARAIVCLLQAEGIHAHFWGGGMQEYCDGVQIIGHLVYIRSLLSDRVIKYMLEAIAQKQQAGSSRGHLLFRSSEGHTQDHAFLRGLAFNSTLNALLEFCTSNFGTNGRKCNSAPTTKQRCLERCVD